MMMLTIWSVFRSVTAGERSEPVGTFFEIEIWLGLRFGLRVYVKVKS